MKNIVLDLIGVILLHIFTVAVLGGIALFVWNVGAVALVPTLQKIEYLPATAVMTGIYVVDLFVKSYVNRIIAYKTQKNLSELLFKEEKK